MTASKRPPRVAIYAVCNNGDKSSLILAQLVCSQQKWLNPLEYVDNAESGRLLWRDLLGDISIGDYIDVLVTCFDSQELADYCDAYGCQLIHAG